MRRIGLLIALTIVVFAGFAVPIAAQDATPVGSPIAGDPESIVRAFYEPFNTGDVSIYEQILAPDWMDHPLAPGQQPGAAGFGPVVLGFRTAFPDLHLVNEDILVDGDKVAVRSTFTGTHQGDLFGIPPTGRHIEAMAIDIHRLEGGRIAETWHVEDWLTVLGQLGALGGPQEGTPAASG